MDQYICKQCLIRQYWTYDFFSVQGADLNLLLSCFTPVEMVLIFKAVGRRATQENRKIDTFFSAPCEMYNLMGPKINMTNWQQRESM